MKFISLNFMKNYMNIFMVAMRDGVGAAFIRTGAGAAANSLWRGSLLPLGSEAGLIHSPRLFGWFGVGPFGAAAQPSGSKLPRHWGGGSQEIGVGLNDSTRLRSEPGYASLLEGAPMKSKSLVACLLVAASLSTASVVVQAGDTPQETVQPSNINARDLKEGDRAPDMLMRKELAVSDWKKRGLKQPEEDSQWARVGDKFVLLKTTNGTILEITPVKQ
jgi:hypothetical protein